MSRRHVAAYGFGGWNYQVQGRAGCSVYRCHRRPRATETRKTEPSFKLKKGRRRTVLLIYLLCYLFLYSYLYIYYKHRTQSLK